MRAEVKVATMNRSDGMVGVVHHQLRPVKIPASMLARRPAGRPPRWLSVPAGIYFLWVVRRLYKDSLGDWNQGPDEVSGVVASEIFV